MNLKTNKIETIEYEGTILNGKYFKCPYCLYVFDDIDCASACRNECNNKINRIIKKHKVPRDEAIFIYREMIDQ